MCGEPAAPRGQGGLNKKAAGEHMNQRKARRVVGEALQEVGTPRKGTEEVSLVRSGRQRHTHLHQRTMVVSRTKPNRQRTQKGIFLNR